MSFNWVFRFFNWVFTQIRVLLRALHDNLQVDATPPAGREYQDYNDPEYDEKKERKLDNRLRGEWRGRQQVASYSQQVDATPPAGRDYRGEAELHHRLRGECFHKAQDAYRRGLGQDASFYSQQGHVHTQKIKEANMRASEQILQDRNGVLERNNNLDLHGLHVDEAIVALDRILPLKAKERYQSHLTIITGRGSHSRGGVARLRPSVLAYLQRHQYSFNEPQPGAFRVLLRNGAHDR